MSATNAKLPFKKETKNMLQYQAEEDDRSTSPIPTLYIRKDVFGENWPPFIEIAVKGVSE